MPRLALAALTLLAVLSGCAAFDTHRVPGGPTGCKKVCEGWGMELSGMVQVGRDSDACVCGVKKDAGSGLLRGGAIGALAAVDRLHDEEQPADMNPSADRPVAPGVMGTIRIPLPAGDGKSPTP